MYRYWICCTRFVLFSLLLGLAVSCKQSGSSQQDSHSQNNSLPTSVTFTQEGGFTSGIEGPAVDAEGNIYVVNFGEQGTIGKVSPAGIAELFVKLPEGSVGNGIRIDSEGFLYIADYPQHNVLKIDPASQEIFVFAHDSTMNQPNDLAIRSDGNLFASDPNWKESTGNLWRIDPNGQTHLLESEMSTTNGIEVSPDESLLYVNESVSRKVWSYSLSPEGDISNKQLLIEFPDFGMDGMRCDSQGNLYITRHGKGTVAIVSPDGKLLNEIQLTGTKPSNIAFGGPDGKTCYVTLQDKGNLETFRSEYPGRAWGMRK